MTPIPATSLTVPIEVMTIMLGVIGFRGSLAAFVALARGDTPRQIADEMASATAAAFPSAVLVGLLVTVYLSLHG